MVYHLMLCRYARTEGLGRLVFERNPVCGLILSLVCSFGLTYAVLPQVYLVIPASLVIFGVVWSLYTKHKIGGGTGDTLGAAEELAEVLTLLLLASVVR